MQTATESTDLRSVQAQLEHLRAGVASIAASEHALIKQRAERLVGIRKETTQREEQDEEKLAKAIQELLVLKVDAIASVEERFATRGEVVHQAYHSSRNAVAHLAQGVKDRRIGQVQGAIMRNRQARQDELERAKEEHEAFASSLVSARKVRRDLRKRAMKIFSSFLPLTRKEFDKKKPGMGGDGKTMPETLRKELAEKLDLADAAVSKTGGMVLTKLLRFLPLWLIMVLLPLVHFSAVRQGGIEAIPWIPILISEAAVIVLWFVAFMVVRPAILNVAGLLVEAKALEIEAEKESSRQLAALDEEIHSEQAVEGQSLSETFRESDSEWKERLAKGQRKLEQQFARLPGRLEKIRLREIGKIEARHEDALTAARLNAKERSRVTGATRDRFNTSIEDDIHGKIGDLTLPWEMQVMPKVGLLTSLESESIRKFPSWDKDTSSNWTPPAETETAIRLGHIEVDTAVLTEGLPHDSRLAMANEGRLTVPFSLGFPHQGSIMIESDGESAGASTQALNGIALRLLASHPPGRASFVFIDPVGLGKDFSGLMHLADYEETLIHHRIWTQSTQIEERLAELNDHIEKVIQMYLRNEYADITEYNEQAGTIAEKYRFLVIAGFPSAFSETSCKRLLSIVSSGARCGVHVLIQRDLRQPIPDTALEEELRRECLRVIASQGKFQLADAPKGADSVVFDAAPNAEDSITLVHRIGKASVDSNRVQVPFSHIAPTEDELWSSETTDELRVPVGRTGAKKLQMLAIGKGTRQHALVAGKTGSGKSTLFHVIITNLALWCRPDQVEFYLVDFKKGVEFKCYAEKRLPHARVIAIESDREFALSVLQRIDAELKRRGELFRKAGAQDVAGYKRTADHEPMPRSLLLIDEFQEFFTEDDSVAQEASLLLDRIVRQGRAFGIHVILGSQTLGGAYTLARATLGQMVIRVALQCNEVDAHLIMDDDNPAPRMLTRPGEGIYNDQAGALAANSPFQIVWLPENERDDLLDKVNEMAKLETTLPSGPIVFEGNAPADIRDNEELRKLWIDAPSARPQKARAWLGAPNSIKGPTEAIFQRQSGSHLLIVGQAAERALSMLSISMVSLAAQYPPEKVEFVILDPHAHDNSEGIFHKLAATLSHKVTVGGSAEAPELLADLSRELDARAFTSGRDAPEVFLIVHDLQRFKALRPDDEFRFSMDDDAAAAVTPSQAFANLLGEGGPVGMHVLAATDTWNNVSRWIPRKLLAEIEMRVLFQMSANDSSNLIDSPAATSLGLHRALLYNEHQGTTETFRPYAMPDESWLEELSRDAVAQSNF